MNANLMALISIVLGLLLGIASGCTKERPYDAVYKDGVLDKSVVNTEDEFVYLPSVVDSPRQSSATRPHWMGIQKIVKMRFTENAIKVYEIEADERFAENTMNEKPVLSIPVEHLEYRCAENGYGECSNKEESNDELKWDQKTKFKPDFAKVEIEEANFLPLEITNMFEHCYNETESQFVDYTIEKDAIQFRVDKTFQITNEACFKSIKYNSLEEFVSGMTFKVRYAYSMVKLSSLASKDYEPVTYPQSDENTFGFFSTEKFQMTSDNQMETGSKTVYMNRWNPRKKEVVYYLTGNFDKPEFDGIKKATYESFDIINNGLKRAGVDTRLVLKDPKKGIEDGDLRHNMIVLVEDPQALSVIGYGPSVANPRTGEILNSKVVMYGGTITKFIRYTYDEWVGQESKPTDTAGAAPKAMAFKQVSDARNAVAKVWQSTYDTFAKAAPMTESRVSPNSYASEKFRLDSSALEKELHATILQKTVAKDRLATELDVLSAHCAYPAEHFNFDSAIGPSLKKIFKKGTPLKPWAELSEKERSKILAILSPYVWVPTLVHELGHNLGLRHNFAGSEDRENFYTSKERIKLGIAEKMPYSSVMDYAFSELNSLKALGKYDIAALKFGYERQVELQETDKKGNVRKRWTVGVPKDLGEIERSFRGDDSLSLRPYSYCTDEHVAVNPGCKRFDEGTTLAGIAKHLVKTYDRFYKRRNFRNGALDFSLTNDATYAAGVADRFYNLRMFIERVEQIEAKYSLTEEDWKSIKPLKYLAEGAATAQNFFMQVLKTPDVMCLLAPKADPEALELVQLAAIGGWLSCSDPEFGSRLDKAGYKLIGQTGKSFQSKKAPNGDNPYADQVDVRGIWIDKLLALKFLLARDLGVSTFDTGTDNSLDRKGMLAQVYQTVESILSDNVTGALTFELADGGSATINASYSLGSTHVIDRPFSDGLAEALGLPDAQSTFRVEMLRALQRYVPRSRDGGLSSSFAAAFAVHQAGPNGNIPHRVFKDNARTFVALPENLIANALMDEVSERRIFDEVGDGTLLLVLQVMIGQLPPEEGPASTPEIEAAKALGIKKMVKFLKGKYLESSAGIEMLETMAEAGKS